MPERVEDASASRFWLGEFGEQLADEVIFCVKRIAPTPWIEVHCHGGREVVLVLTEALAARGCAVIDWQEFLERTSASALEASASIALTRARTIRTAGILLDQFHGALASTLGKVIDLLDTDRGDEASRQLQAMADRGQVGRRLTEPWRVVIAGAPNVGKSSLINALAGYQRAIVSETPGTTRDVVTTTLAVDGWLIELADTAGVRAGGDPLEQRGIELAAEKTDQADLCLWVTEASARPVWPGDVRVPVRHVVNKIDLPPNWDISEAPDAMHVSARTGRGVPDLCDALSRWLVPHPPAEGDAVPFAPEICEAIETALKHCKSNRLTDARACLLDLMSPACGLA